MAVCFILAVASGIDAVALDGQFATVTLAAISGYSGHAFVFAQVVDSYAVLPAPDGRTFDSPYYSQWVSFPANAPGCPFIWAVYVYDKRTGIQINPVPPGTPGLNFQTSTLICPTPSSTPVGAPALSQARARLDLDLLVSVSPPAPVAGQPSVLAAALAGSVVNDLNLYLSMAVKQWRVADWRIDFGDGVLLTLAGRGSNYLRLQHVFPRPGHYRPRVVARITGRAQAAAYDRAGNPYLIDRDFEVEVGNSTIASVAGAPLRNYHPPDAVATVTPVIYGSGVLPGSVAFRQVDVFRATLTDFYLRPLLLREGYMTVNGVASGSSRSTLVAWRFTGPASDAPGKLGTEPNSRHPATQPLRLQWNAPGPVVRARGQDYTVPVTLYLRSVYPDGNVELHAVNSSFAVTVNFTAENG
jgi:hypothetical protein